MLRTNLSFMAVNNPVKVIMLTSLIPHSGKTFVSTNLAATLALTSKRVLLIDLDLRRRTLTKILGHRNDRRGLTSYLSGKINLLNDIISESSIAENVDIIYSGPLPPNPAEMLMSEQMDSLMRELRGLYDYIIIDSVPAMAVADAMIIDRLVDMTMYVIRKGNLDRRQLPDIERLHKSNKFHNMCIVLNGVSQSKHNYGYGYGYGYNTEEDATLWQRRWTTFKRLFKKRD
jgi:capsular exopolysaccharide synthesis family protein